MTRVLMEGSHAIAEAAIQAGCRFYAGDPITPSTEILEYMSHRLPQVGGVCMNAESELEAINMVWGAAGCGVRAMIASTGQGISLMQESFAELANAEIPCVIVNMMRGQGDYYQATRGGGHGDYRHIVLAPHTVQEAVDLVMLAFHLADRWRNPALVLGDSVLGHTSAVVAFGSPARFVKYAVHACRAQGMKVGWVRPISLWPFPAETVAAAAVGVRALAVFEQNAGQMIDDVRLAVLGKVPVVPIGGISHDPSGFGVGPALEPVSIIAKITEVYRGKAAA